MRKKSSFKIVCATFLAIFNLLICFIGTYTWFMAARINDASSMQLQIYTHELDMSYRVYKYSDDEKAPINATGSNNALALQEYDSVIKSRNYYTPIIIEFTIMGMDLSENLPININTHCTNNTTTARVLSNIVQLKFAVIPSITSFDPVDIYYGAVNYFEEAEGVLFKNNNVKSQDILYTINNYSNYLTNGSLKLYIQLDYSEPLIDSFEFSITDATTTSFTNDLTLINCYTEDN